jgi:hypothetical protein
VSCCNQAFAPQRLLSCPPQLRRPQPWHSPTRADPAVRQHLAQPLRRRASPRRRPAQLQLRASPRRHPARLQLRALPRRHPARLQLRASPRRALLLSHRRHASRPLRALRHSVSPVRPADRLPAPPRGTSRRREALQRRGRRSNNRRSNKSGAVSEAKAPDNKWADQRPHRRPHKLVVVPEGRARMSHPKTTHARTAHAKTARAKTARAKTRCPPIASDAT